MQSVDQNEKREKKEGKKGKKEGGRLKLMDVRAPSTQLNARNRGCRRLSIGDVRWMVDRGWE